MAVLPSPPFPPQVCNMCRLPFTEPSYGAGICSLCDCGDFGIQHVKLQKQKIEELEQQLVIANKRVKELEETAIRILAVLS